MKTLPLSLVKLANRLGLVRGQRAVRVRGRHESGWSLAVHLPGGWVLVRQPRSRLAEPVREGSDQAGRRAYFPRLCDLRAFAIDAGL